MIGYIDTAHAAAVPAALVALLAFCFSLCICMTFFFACALFRRPLPRSEGRRQINRSEHIMGKRHRELHALLPTAVTLTIPVSSIRFRFSLSSLSTLLSFALSRFFRKEANDERSSVVYCDWKVCSCDGSTYGIKRIHVDRVSVLSRIP